MASKYRYNVSATSNVDLSAQVRAYRSEATMNAEEGSVAISTLYIDDEAGGLNIIGHRTLFWSEESEGSNTRTILHGFVADRDITRGPFKVLNSRQWAVNVTDPNTLLGRPIMRGTDANRPAETDLARIQWLMTTGEMNLITDSTYVNTGAATTAMDAADYRDQTVLSIIDDCAQASGKNYFVFRNEFLATPALGLWYDFSSSSAYSSAVRLTNVLADIDSTTTYGVFTDDLKLNRDPSRVYSSVLLPFDGGEVFVTDDSIRLAFARRDTTAPSINVKSTAKATARAQRYLRDIATEEDRITMSYLVPLARVNQLREGQTFQVKFSHFPGYESWTWVRALKRTVKAESEEFYRVTLEATQAAPSGSASCSTSLSSMTGTFADTGQSSSHSAITLHPASVSTVPSMNIGVAFGSENTGFTSYNGSHMASAPWTFIDFLATNVHTAISYSYLRSSSAGAPSDFVFPGFSGSGGDPIVRAISFSFPTSATAPRQFGQVSGGIAVTLGSPVVAGNMLVLLRIFENVSGTPPSVSTGFTQVGSYALSGIANATLLVMARCADGSEGSNVNIDVATYSNFAFLSEWTI